MNYRSDSAGCIEPKRLTISAEGRVLLCAPAKINLNLLVSPRGEDGYHAVDSYIARITLYDQIELTRRDDGQIVLACEGFDCGPADKNLARLAAEALAPLSRSAGVEIRLTKHIPPGGGLGGGSSDAAAVLMGLSELWGLNLSADELTRAAEPLGSDVPMFLGPPAARMTGRGECITPVNVSAFWAVLYMPAVSCPTAEVYRAYDALEQSEVKQFDAALLAEPCSKWRGMLVNQLAPAAEKVCQPLKELRQKFSAACGEVHMTGSGSAMFVLCDSAEEANQLFSRLDDDLRSCCTIVKSNPW